MTVNRCVLGGFDLPLSALIHLSLSHPAVAPVLAHCHAGAVAVLQTVALTLIILILHKADQTVMDVFRRQFGVQPLCLLPFSSSAI